MTHNDNGPIFGVRHVQAVLLFLCFLVNFMSRQNVSVAIVAMMNSTTTNPDFPEYKFDEKQISYILSSAFWGMTLSQLPGSYMCRRIGAKQTLLISTFGSAILSIVTPVCMPYGGWKIYSGIRLIQGFFQGLLFPCLNEHISKWAPTTEVTRLGSFSYNGMPIGTILAMAPSGFIAKSSWGWPGISYFAGGLGLIWCVLWIILADNTPYTSRFISIEEKTFIEASQKRKPGAHKNIPIPWKAIFTSIPFLSYMGTHIARIWGYTTIIAQIPLYMKGVQHMSITNNAIFSAIPYVAMFLMSFVYIGVVDVMMKKCTLRLVVVKKTINTIAMWIPAALLVVLGFLDANEQVLAVVMVTLAVGINAGTTIGAGMNTIELSPNHAAILGAIAFMAINFVSIATPLYAGHVVTDQSDRNQWQIVFVTTALFLFIGNLQYLFFGTTEKQPWNAEDFLFKKSDIETQKDPQAHQKIEPTELNVLLDKNKNANVK